MKKLFLSALVIVSLFATSICAQNVGINSTGGVPNNSAGLDVDFTNKGVLVPRVALTGSNDVVTIAAPATSLLVYNTATANTYPNDVKPGYYYWNGTKWERIASDMLNSSQTSSVGKFYAVLSWTGTWTTGTALTWVVNDPLLVCGATLSAVFANFDCINSNAVMAGFTIRNIKINAGNMAVTILNNSGNYTNGALQIVYVAFY